ncbi:hypothetical protein ACFQS7_27405 [Dankookia sp. GCM10030260]|uniref:hypothetical protein n=1 Tax=Dankookia sp. GCM10030260 TaxID=3273390 RepID=UPI00361BBDCD
MNRSTVFSTITILGALAVAPALAQAPSILAYSSTGNVVGGGGASFSGGGTDSTITYGSIGAGGGASYGQRGRMTLFDIATGDDFTASWMVPGPSSPGREAWLSGGGDDAQVSYIDPSTRRRR